MTGFTVQHRLLDRIRQARKHCYFVALQVCSLQGHDWPGSSEEADKDRIQSYAGGRGRVGGEKDCTALKDLRVQMPMIFIRVTTMRDFKQQHDFHFARQLQPSLAQLSSMCQTWSD